MWMVAPAWACLRRRFLARLQGPVPTELGQLRSVVKLYLHRNFLTGRVPSEFAMLHSLETLWVRRLLFVFVSH